MFNALFFIYKFSYFFYYFNKIFLLLPLYIYICSLFVCLFVCLIKKMCLIQSKPTMPLIQELPMIKLTPIDQNSLKQLQTLPVPLFLTKCKCLSELVCTLHLPIKEDSSHWILQGLSVFLNPD